MSRGERLQEFLTQDGYVCPWASVAARVGKVRYLELAPLLGRSGSTALEQLETGLNQLERGSALACFPRENPRTHSEAANLAIRIYFRAALLHQLVPWQLTCTNQLERFVDMGVDLGLSSGHTKVLPESDAVVVTRPQFPYREFQGIMSFATGPLYPVKPDAPYHPRYTPDFTVFFTRMEDILGVARPAIRSVGTAADLQMYRYHHPDTSKEACIAYREALLEFSSQDRTQSLRFPPGLPPKPCLSHIPNTHGFAGYPRWLYVLP